MIVFINEDEAYLHWLDQNPDGVVLNTRRRPSAEYLKLHRASCLFVSTSKRQNWTTGQYIKICSLDKKELADWVRTEFGTELDPGCRCNSAIDSPAVPETRSDTVPVSPSPCDVWVTWWPKEQFFKIESLEPLKASWEKSTDPSQVRLREYRQRISKAFEPYVQCDSLYLHLDVAFSDYAKMMAGNDLENYLTPLFECACLPARLFRRISATKFLGDQSTLVIGSAEPEAHSRTFFGFEHTSFSPTVPFSKEKEWKLELEGALRSAVSSPLPAGEVEVCIALKRSLGQGRSWHCLWKATGDAMGPVLGHHKRKNQFDPQDDRITSLTLQLCPDEAMGRRIDVGYWWRSKTVS
jgi:hypothetical protein